MGLQGTVPGTKTVILGTVCWQSRLCLVLYLLSMLPHPSSRMYIFFYYKALPMLNAPVFQLEIHTLLHVVCSLGCKVVLESAGAMEKTIYKLLWCTLAGLSAGLAVSASSCPSARWHVSGRIMGRNGRIRRNTSDWICIRNNRSKFTNLGKFLRLFEMRV